MAAERPPAYGQNTKIVVLDIAGVAQPVEDATHSHQRVTRLEYNGHFSDNSPTMAK